MTEKTQAYTLDSYLEIVGMASDFADLKVKLKNSMTDGTFLDDSEVMLILTVFAHAAGMEKAFNRLFGELTHQKQEEIGALREDREPREKP